MESNTFRLWFGKLLDALRFEKASGPKVDDPKDRRQDAFSVVSDGITIRGQFFFPVARPSKMYPCIVICHGIPGSGEGRPADDPGYEAVAREFASLGIVGVIFNFRGCGESGGDFDMGGWVRDLDMVVEHVVNTPYIDPSRLLVLGYSGGGAAAIRTAADKEEIYGLAVVGTPADFEIFEDDPQEIISEFKERGIIRDPDFPPDVDRWVQKFVDIQPKRWVRHFKGKSLLIVHGDQDELIPAEHAHDLADAAPAGTAKLSIIPGGVHRLRLDPRCSEIVREWAQDTLGRK